ncbi:DUF1493 family protein [Adhaeribacter swui]|uniref:DUF1493 family protein n=1 Tax=Adhaeribacter swui TaxID=2086471 RepID=A0A7G7G3W9_9BACT|nr:DUF1493 family protein [Adhaeribacter swui]QNF31853.1 DUF1493 family protein [Adhaeribacter swui]
MEAVEIRYSYLREVSESVVNFIKTEYWWEDDTNFKSSIENDLGITGDDAVELLEKFAQKFKVDLDGFDFSKYFSPEGVYVNPLLIPIIALLITLFLVKTFIAGIVYPFDSEQGKKIFNFINSDQINKFFNKIWPSKLEKLTVEDLITTAIKGKFIKRETVKFVIKKGVA